MIAHRIIQGLKTRAIEIVVKSNQNNFNLYNEARAAGWDGLDGAIINVIIMSGIVIGSRDSTLTSFETGFLGNTEVTLINYGIIAGKGGIGGNGGNVIDITANSGSMGQKGGDALKIDSLIKLDNHGIIAGGGGGGGGGGSIWYSITVPASMGVTSIYNYAVGGGGGGAGQGCDTVYGGAGGTANTTSGTINQNSPGMPGASGDLNVSGAGGAGGLISDGNGTFIGGAGGPGGTFGINGSSGSSSLFNSGIFLNGSSPGQAGRSIVGVRNVTFMNRGNIKGIEV